MKQLLPRRSRPPAAGAASAPSRLLLQPPERIVAAHPELLRRLGQLAGAGESQFRQRFAAPLQRLAAHVNALPATPTGLFRAEGGLFRAALENAVLAFEQALARRFAAERAPPVLEARWRYLCFLAGLLFPLGRTLTRVAVHAPDGPAWQRHLGGLTAWAASVGAACVAVRWRPADGGEEIGPDSGTIILLPDVVGADNLQFLEDAAYDLVGALYRLASGEDGQAPAAHEVVAGCWNEVVRRESARLLREEAG